jgi:tetratricopeptide (TPR) repeat protein
MIKKWLIRAGFVILPFALIAASEAVLRLTGYGPGFDPLTEIAAQPDYLQVNPELGRNYFPHTGYRPHSSGDRILKVKPENAFRIFVFGGSEPAGFPYYHNGTMPRLLQARLQDTRPAMRMEVVNFSLPLLGSRAVADMVEKTLNGQPDLILVCSGNEEFYGATSVASLERDAGWTWLNELWFLSRELRLLHLLGIGAGESLPQEVPDKSELPLADFVAQAEIAGNSDIFRQAVDEYGANLQRIADEAKAAGVAVIFCEPTVNRRSSPPAVSLFNENSNQSNWERQVNSADALVQSGELAGARALLETVVAADTLVAESHFRLALVCAAMGDTEQAGYYFNRALELDALRLRAPGAIVKEMKRVAGLNDIPFILLTDSLEQLDRDLFTGWFNEQFEFALPEDGAQPAFVDYRHSSLSGKFIQAREIAKFVLGQRMIPGNSPQNLPADSVYVSRSGVTPLDRAAAKLRLHIERLDWPYRHEPAIRQFTANYRPDNFGAELVWNEYRGVIDWYQMHQQMAQRHEEAGNYPAAIGEYQALITANPGETEYYNALAAVCYRAGLKSRMRETLLRSYAIQPTKYAAQWLGVIYVETGSAMQGLEYLRTALQFDNQDTGIMYNIAVAQANLHQHDNAMRTLEILMEIDPQNRSAQNMYRQLQVLTGNTN